jgi:coproporphyrinogen III oxidase
LKVEEYDKDEISTLPISEARAEWIRIIFDLQNSICTALEKEDGKAKFTEDRWERAEGGGGKTRVISDGNVFEKGGVNTSVVYGDVTDAMRSQLKMGKAAGEENSGKPMKWFACGLSIVLHPLNPFVPTVHCNYRMFELYGNDGEKEYVADRWFGGGTDLTPYYLFEEDAIHFHTTYKKVCDAFDPGFYTTFKKLCDDYFVNHHRNNERRGIGGIFYDHQRPDNKHNLAFWMNFGKACGNAFTEAYLPFVTKRKFTTFTEKQKHWQEIRRGRYVEFNLVHDRGTIFGLKTNGRTESILMSLPPTVRFEYDYKPEPGSEEDKLWQACLHPLEWV